MAKKPPSINRIKEVLKEKGMTQAALADALGVRYITVNRIVNGHQEPTLKMLSQIAKLLKVSPRDLIRE